MLKQLSLTIDMHIRLLIRKTCSGQTQFYADACNNRACPGMPGHARAGMSHRYKTIEN
jgi:hypothetical protein